MDGKRKRGQLCHICLDLREADGMARSQGSDAVGRGCGLKRATSRKAGSEAGGQEGRTWRWWEGWNGWGGKAMG